MTRWAQLLSVLGVNPSTFDVQHQSKFDLSPEEWLQQRLDELSKDKPDLFRSIACKQLCCQEIS